MIPVIFTFKGREYKGHLSPVSGASSSLYHLIIGGYYKGQLFKTDQGWRLTTQKGEIEKDKDVVNYLINAVK